MGFDNAADLIDDPDAGGKNSPVSCSICLDAVTRNGDRSRAKLLCGHEFHLDCIGSAFNVKGAMQCPNCRKIEKGQWLYANGSRPFPELSMEDWTTHDEDLYDLSFSEMSVGVHWCPFNGLSRFPSSFDDGEFSSTAYHDPIGQHAIYAEHTAISSAAAATHPCPYIAYLGPIQPSTSSTGGGSGSADGPPNYNSSSHWNNNGGASSAAVVPATNDMHNNTSFAFPSMDFRYHHSGWEHHSSPLLPTTTTSSRTTGGFDQRGQPPPRANSDIPPRGSFTQPFHIGHSSAAGGARSSVVSSLGMYPYQGSAAARSRERVQALQAYFQQPSNPPPTIRAPAPHIVSGSRRSNSHNRGGGGGGGPAQVSGPVASMIDQLGGSGIYYYPPLSVDRHLTEVENYFSSVWEREQLPSFAMHNHHQQQQQQVVVLDRDNSVPGWPYYPTDNTTNAATRSTTTFRPRHGSDQRMPSQNRS